MAIHNNGGYMKGSSITRSPSLGSNYTYWKTRTMIYLKSIDYNFVRSFTL